MKMKETFKCFRNMLKRNGGFTLVELIVVIAILAILAGVAIPAYSGYITKANEAADQQLLSAVNRAFTAACVDNAINPYTLTSSDASAIINSSKKVEIKKPAAIIEDFNTYFAGNENATFNVYTVLAYDPTTASFKASAMSDLYTDLMNAIISGNADAINKFKDSAFNAIGTDALLEQVADVSNMASQLIAGDSLLTAVVMNDDYIASLAARLGKTSDELKAELDTKSPEEFHQYLANSTVLNVAGTMNDANKFNEAETLDMFATANWGGLGTTLNTDPERGLAQAAALYGLYTAYNPDAASQLAVNGDAAALLELKNDAGFTAYLANVNTEGTQAYKDYQAYKATLGVVNESANNSDVANDILTNGYDNAELQALLQGVMGG